MSNINCSGQITTKNLQVEENATINGTNLMQKITNIESTITSLSQNVTNLNNNTVKTTDIVYGSNTYGKYMKFPNGVLICWNRIPDESTSTIEINLPYPTNNTDYVVVWGMESSLDTAQSFRGMGAWNKTTTTFTTRQFGSAAKVWLLIGTWK